MLDAIKIKKEFGYTGIPITENGNIIIKGKIFSKLLGMITYRDIEFFDP